MGGDCSLFQLVLAVFLASFLSHVSMLLLLGRTDELYRGFDMLTEGFCDGPATTPTPMPMPRAPRLPYPMCDTSAIPQAVPAGDPGFGAPLGWQNPATSRRPEPQGRNPACFTQNYYLN